MQAGKIKSIHNLSGVAVAARLTFFSSVIQTRSTKHSADIKSGLHPACQRSPPQTNIANEPMLRILTEVVPIRNIFFCWRSAKIEIVLVFYSKASLGTSGWRMEVPIKCLPLKSISNGTRYPLRRPHRRKARRVYLSFSSSTLT